jgi:hypothetical protein
MISSVAVLTSETVAGLVKVSTRESNAHDAPAVLILLAAMRLNLIISLMPPPAKLH